MILDEHLEEVEKFGFGREVFPLRHNSHVIHLLKNDARITTDDRLQVHFVLYCHRCDSESRVRGKCQRDTDWTPAHLQDVKLVALGQFVTQHCSGRKT